MNANKQKKLEAAGWSVGSAADFLALTETEEILVGMRLALASPEAPVTRDPTLDPPSPP
ncbi:MAG TPA: hypothetical protein PLA50_08265 [Bacteroidia bacterium]|nr:hypothetical protein [Bacteroidia bacterium]